MNGNHLNDLDLPRGQLKDLATHMMRHRDVSRDVDFDRGRHLNSANF